MASSEHRLSFSKAKIPIVYYWSLKYICLLLSKHIQLSINTPKKMADSGLGSQNFYLHSMLGPGWEVTQRWGQTSVGGATVWWVFWARSEEGSFWGGAAAWCTMVELWEGRSRGDLQQWEQTKRRHKGDIVESERDTEEHFIQRLWDTLWIQSMRTKLRELNNNQNGIHSEKEMKHPGKFHQAGQVFYNGWSQPNSMNCAESSQDE